MLTACSVNQAPAPRDLYAYRLPRYSPPLLVRLELKSRILYHMGKYRAPLSISVGSLQQWYPFYGSQFVFSHILNTYCEVANHFGVFSQLRVVSLYFALAMFVTLIRVKEVSEENTYQ